MKDWQPAGRGVSGSRRLPLPQGSRPAADILLGARGRVGGTQKPRQRCTTRLGQEPVDAPQTTARLHVLGIMPPSPHGQACHVFQVVIPSLRFHLGICIQLAPPVELV